MKKEPRVRQTRPDRLGASVPGLNLKEKTRDDELSHWWAVGKRKLCSNFVPVGLIFLELKFENFIMILTNDNVH